LNAPRTDRVLGQTDPFHRASAFLSEAQLLRGRVRLLPNQRDGVARTELRVSGQVNGVSGTFEFFIEPNGIVSHQLFRPY